MDDPFQIWVDRLKQGQSQAINESLSPDFLDLEEDELQAKAPVVVKGKAYLTEAELILNIDASTRVKMPCSVCNKMTDIDLVIENFYHAHPLEEIPSGVYDFRTPLREALVIELPKYIECNEGKCPSRTELTPYLKGKNKAEEDVHFPFSNLGDSNGSTS